MSSARRVIIGNGVAGMEAARLLKKADPRADVTIVSEESDHFFSRPALMWIHAGQLDHEGTEPLERDGYAKLGIRRVRARAVGVDVTRKVVRLAGDVPELAYDTLLIACGSKPRRAPWQTDALLGVGHFVTHQDLAWLEEEMYGTPNRKPPPNADAHLRATTDDSPYRFRASAAAKRGHPAKRLAVIGGGLIGIEVIELALARGIEAHFFLRDAWLWPMAIDANESAFICARLAAHGVIVHTNAKVTGLVADDASCVKGVTTETETVPVDCVVVAIGVEANTDWLGDAIERDERGAIVVDERMRTSTPDVYAAGDCAAVPFIDGTKRPELLWYTGRDQGRVAARAMLGEPATYVRGPWYNSAKLMDVEYTTVGLVNMGVPDERSWYFEERGRVTSTTRIVLSGDRVIGFNMLGRRWDHEVLIGFIVARRSLAYVLEHLHDAAFDTEMVPPLVIPPDARSRAAASVPTTRDPIPLPNW